MRVVHSVCAGMDVHKKDVKVCLVSHDKQGKRQEEVRTFSTMTGELLRLRDWLQDHGCKVVAMESTGVYWKPIFTAEIVLAALEMALWNRQPEEGVIHHSDHGSQYTSLAFGQRLEQAGVLGSMGTVGDALDNAVASLGTKDSPPYSVNCWTATHGRQSRGYVRPSSSSSTSSITGKGGTRALLT